MQQLGGGALGGIGTLGMGGLAKGGVVAANKAIAAEALKRGLGGTTAATLQGGSLQVYH